MNISTDPSDEEIQSFLSNDSLGQNTFLNSLMRLLIKIDDGAIIDLDGQWGSGKTTVIREIQLILDDKVGINNIKNIDKNIINELQTKYSIFYFNAWENDQYDPSESIIYQLIAKYWSTQEKIGEKIVAASKSFLSNLTSKITLSSLDPDDFSEHDNIEKMIEDIYTTNNKRKAASDIIEGVLDKNRKEHLIFIVDELDRCNPSYAVKLIEVIKHYFANNRVKVLFVTNNRQLSSIIEKNYGEKFSGYEYLDKIFDLIINMPDYGREKFIETHNRSSIKEFSDAIVAIAEYYHMSLREMERFMLLMDMSIDYIDSSILNGFSGHGHRDACYLAKNLLIPLILGAKIKNIDDFNVLISFRDDSVQIFSEIVSKIEYAREIIKNINSDCSTMSDAARLYSELLPLNDNRYYGETKKIRDLIKNMVSNIRI